MYGYIYQTVNRVNDKVYVGQHKGEFNPEYLGSGIYINRAIRKYGKDKFIVSVVAIANSRKEADDLEKKYIEEYKKNHQVYNLAGGGIGGDTFKDNPDKKKKAIEKQLETRKKNGTYTPKWLIGRKHKPETINKMIENHADFSGRNNPKYGKKMSISNKVKLLNATLGTKLINKNDINKRVPIAKVDQWLIDGWKLGHSRKGVKNGNT